MKCKTVTQNKSIKQLTSSLIDYIEKLEQTFYQHEAVDMNSKSAFEFVKEETEPIFEVLETWEKLTLKKIEQRKISLPTSMVESTVDNMSALIMHSYYKDVRKRRYMEIKKSLLYVLRMLLKELRNDD